MLIFAQNNKYDTRHTKTHLQEINKIMPNTEKRDNTKVQILPTDNPMEYLQKQWELAARKSREEKQREEAAKNIESNMKAAQQRFNDRGLWNSEDPYEVYNTYETEPQKQAEFKRNGQMVAGIGGTIATLPFTAGTIGWIPAITTTTTSVAGGYGGQKLGEVIDKKYDTNLTPWLTFAGGMIGGGVGYRGLVNLGSKGLLRGVGNMYSDSFISDVVSDGLTRGLKNPNLYNKIKLFNLKQSSKDLTWNSNFDHKFVFPKESSTAETYWKHPTRIVKVNPTQYSYPGFPSDVSTEIFDLNMNLIGKATATEQNGYLVPDFMNNLTKNQKHVSLDIYDGLLHGAKQLDLLGVRSGDKLMSPIKTRKIWDYYLKSGAAKELDYNGSDVFNGSNQKRIVIDKPITNDIIYMPK